MKTPLLAHDAKLTVPLPDLRELADEPAALIIRFQGAAVPARVSVSMDDRPMTAATIPANDELRVYASTAISPGAKHEVIFAGDRAGWQLAYLEVANVYGFSRGVIDFVVVPHERRHSAAIPGWLLIPIAIGLLASAPRPDWAPGALARWLHRVLAAAVLVLFGCALVADSFTQYKILLSLETFVLGVAILYAGTLVRIWRRALLGSAVLQRWAHYLPHAAVGVMVLGSVGTLYDAHTGFTALIAFGEQFEPRALPALRQVPHAVNEGSGYDGQFYAQLALDPLLRSDEISTALDNATYRGRRILLPWVAWTLGLGQSRLVLQAYALLNVIAWALLGWLLLRWLPAGSVRSTLAWSTCALSYGLLASMRYALPDGPSALLLALGIAAVERNERWLAAAILGASGLARETNLLGGVILAPRDRPTVGSARRFALQLIVLMAPLLLWMLYLWALGLPPGGAGQRNFAAPLSAYFEKWIVTIGELRVEGWDSQARFSFVSLIALTTQMLVLASAPEWRNPWWRMGVTYAVLMTILGAAVWEGHPGAAVRVVVPMTLAFNILIPRRRWFWPLWILGNANVFHGLEVLRVP